MTIIFYVMLYGALIISLFSDAAAHIFLKISADKKSLFKWIPFNFWGLLGVGFFIVDFLLWSFVLHHFPLTVAFPLSSLSTVIVMILSKLFLDEKITKYKLFGSILIFIGIFLAQLS